MRARAVRRTAEPGRAWSSSARRGIAIAWVALAVGVPAFVVALSPLSTVDLAYGIRTGQEVLGGAGIPRVDGFTFTAASMPWVDQPWLAHVIFGGVYGLGGWAALQVLWVGVVAATVGLIARAGFVAGAGLRTSVLVALAGFMVAAQGMGLRAQALGLLCLAGLLLLVAVRRDRPPILWLAVPLLALWANVHGSFVLGVALLAATAVDDRHRRRALWRDVAVLAVGAAATLANPYGTDAWRYVVSIGADPTISAFVTEWQHTDPLQPAGTVYYLSIMTGVVIIALAARRGGRPGAGSWLWLAILAALGAWALRAVAWWGIGAGPVIAVAASQLTETMTDRAGFLEVPGEAGRRRILAGAVAILAVVAAAGLGLAMPAHQRLMDAPSGIADAVRSIGASHPGLRVFDAERWGSWLELDVPDASYFADSRIELIPASAWRDYVAVSGAQSGWQAILDRWQVEVLVLSDADQAGLMEAVASSVEWRIVYRDADGLVAVRA